eukprot:TRINITY_DN813_c0_g4_i1.p2 TRINITY_DN813_c0_g4~~TRINITY_DN813_c0_g4_i1.p2  ORF type:complete len:255 (+),score=49.91 TRINITY_DN813_c0_g4_i1:245-1009(+)
MGLCAHKKRTKTFCFDHKKAVCDSCIVDDHAVCPIGTYREWLEDSEFETPVCGVCRGALTKEKSIRLTCFHLIHTECLDVHGAAQADSNGQLQCATCQAPLIPAQFDASSPLHAKLQAHLSQASWAPTLSSNSAPSSTNSSAPSSSSVQPRASPARLPPPSYAYTSPFGARGVTSRKAPTPISAAQILDEEEDKYRRRDGLARLASKDAAGASGSAVRTRVSGGKVAVIFIVLLAAGALLYTALVLSHGAVVDE